MLKVKKILNSKRIIAVILSMVILFSASFAANLFFSPEETACAFSEKTFYFNNAAHSTVIGYTGYRCDGTFVKSGKSSPYTDTLYCDCFENTK